MTTIQVPRLDLAEAITELRAELDRLEQSPPMPADQDAIAARLLGIRVALAEAAERRERGPL